MDNRLYYNCNSNQVNFSPNQMKLRSSYDPVPVQIPAENEAQK